MSPPYAFPVLTFRLQDFCQSACFLQVAEILELLFLLVPLLISGTNQQR